MMIAPKAKNVCEEKLNFLAPRKWKEGGEWDKKICYGATFLFTFLIATTTFGLFVYTTLKLQEITKEVDLLRVEIEQFKHFLEPVNDVYDEDYQNLDSDRDMYDDILSMPIIVNADYFDGEEKGNLEYVDPEYDNPNGNFNFSLVTTNEFTDDSNSAGDIQDTILIDKREATIEKKLTKRSIQKRNSGDPTDETNHRPNGNGRFSRGPRLRSLMGYNKYQEDVEEIEPTVVGDLPRRRNRNRYQNNFETFDEPIKGRPLPTIQFGGDTSRYVVGQHTNYNGDGHLRHLNRTYVDWKASDWVKPLGMEEKFDLVNGFLKIKENGLYFVYAQIYYLDEHDTNGYRVHRNRDVILQCTVTTHSTSRIIKGNTCYAAGVEYLREGDEISVQDLGNGRYSLFEPGKSFFGVIKLGDIKAK